MLITRILIFFLIPLISCDEIQYFDDSSLTINIENNLEAKNTENFVVLKLSVLNKNKKDIYIPSNDWIIDKSQVSNSLAPGLKNTIHFYRELNIFRPADIGWGASNEFYPKFIEIKKNENKIIWLFIPKYSIYQNTLSLYNDLKEGKYYIVLNFSFISSDNILKIIDGDFSIKKIIQQNDSIFFPINYMRHPRYILDSSKEILDSNKSWELNLLSSNRIILKKELLLND